MSLLPYALRPKVVLRAQIVKRGMIGGNLFLRPIAMILVNLVLRPVLAKTKVAA